MRTVIRLGITLSLVLASGALAATQSGRLEAGDPQLESGEYFDVHFHEGRAGDALTIAIASDDFDPYLIVLAPDGSELLQVDDSPGAGLGVDVTLTLPADGSYTVAVTSAFPLETGAYTLTLSSAAPPARTPTRSLPGRSAGGGTAPAAPPVAQAPLGAGTVLPLGPRPSPLGLGGAPVPGIGPRPGHVTGTVFDTQGRPLAGAGVLVSGTTYGQGQNVSFETVTGADGTYSMRVPDGRYRAQAWIDVQYQGVSYARHLHPLSATREIDTEVGGTLDFQWTLTGLVAPPGDDASDYHGAAIDLSYCGLPADAYCSLSYAAFPDYPVAPGGSTVRVTLVPVAPLVDGSQGGTLVFEFSAKAVDAEYPHGGAPNAPAGYEAGGGGRLVLGADWEYHSENLYDIPLGVYDMSAVALLPDGREQPLRLGLAPDDVEHASVRVTFTPWEGFSGRSYSSGGLYELDVYVRD